jgi:transaldolase
MNDNTGKLHALGQSLWLDNITRRMLDDGTLARYIDERSISGLTSNATIFEHAIAKGNSYDSRLPRSRARADPGRRFSCRSPCTT